MINPVAVIIFVIAIAILVRKFKAPFIIIKDHFDVWRSTRQYKKFKEAVR